MFFIFRTVFAGCAVEVVFSAVLVNEVSYGEPPVDEFGEELVHSVEGMESLPLGWPLNTVELSCHPGVFFSNIFLNHGLLSFTVNALLKLGGDGTSFQVYLGGSVSHGGYLSQLRSGVGVVFCGKSVSIYIQLGC